MDVDREESLRDGLAALQQKNPVAAEQMFRTALTAPGDDDAEALNFLGIALQQQKRLKAARTSFRQAMDADPQWADPVYNVAEALADDGRIDEATEQYERCVTLEPDHPIAWRRLLEIHARAGNLAGAATAGLQALRIAPDDDELALVVGRVMAADPTRLPDVLPLLRQAAAGLPENLEAQVLLYKAASIAKESAVAVAAADRAAELAPGDPKVLLERVSVIRQSGYRDRAVDVAVEYVKTFPEDPAGHHELAVALMGIKEFGAAALAAARTVELRPNHARSLMLLGDIFVRMGRSRESVEPLERSAELDPENASTRMLLSVAFESLGRRREAVEQATTLLELDPDHPDAIGWLGTLRVRQGKHSEGKALFETSLARNPGHVMSLCGWGMLAASQADPEGALSFFQRAIAAAPDDPYPCAAGLLGINAHPTLSDASLLNLHLEWARRLRAQSPAPDRSWPNDPDPERRLKIGYMSPDLRAHSVAYFMEPLLAAHDKSAVEVVVYDSAPSTDNISLHIRQTVDHWRRIVGAGDDRVAELIREDRIDILVDLAAHTADSRVDIFARHPAPVQVTYLGYPNTTGLSEIEYRLTDAFADPVGVSDRYHVEKLVRLPSGFLCFNPPAPHPSPGPLPAGTDGPITFASFNAVHKVTESAIRLWSRAMMAVPGSTLLMKAAGSSDTQTRERLLDRFAAESVVADRIRFAERTERYVEHLEMYSGCDIAFDTFPYNGATTTCEALWMGVPVLTLAGTRHAARVSLSILSQVGLTEFAGDTPDEFVRIAATLAADRRRLADLRATLRDRMRASSLMDAKRHAREIESAFRSMWRSWCGAKHAST